MTKSCDGFYIAAMPKSNTSTARPTTRARKEPEKEPKGGLTPAGRKAFKQREGANLKPGVTGPADTPEKMRRKGSFLRRHFANPRGPMVDENGKLTRLALSAHAWGEPVPKTMAAAEKLAQKGTRLLDRYKAAKAKSKTTAAPKAAPKAKTRPAAKTAQTRKASRASAKAKSS